MGYEVILINWCGVTHSALFFLIKVTFKRKYIACSLLSMSGNYDILHTVLKHGSCIEILSNEEYFRKL